MDTVASNFKANDYLLYLGTGICYIDEIRTENFGGMGEKLYFVMHSVNDTKSVIFVPVDSERLTAGMLRLMTEGEINKCIDLAEKEAVEWIPDNKQRALRFNEIIATGDRLEILKIFRALSLKKLELEGVKKKFYASDERVLAAVGKIITDEFSFVLKIDSTEVIPYIKRRLGVE